MDVNARITALEEELRRLKADVAPAEEHRHSRRNLFKVGALAAGGTALAAVAGAAPASAADAGNLLIGEDNEQDTTDSTVLQYTNAAAPAVGSDAANVLLVTDADTLDATADMPAAVAGYATRVVPVGVAGLGSVDPSWGGLFGGTQANVNLVPMGDAPMDRDGAEAALGDVVNDVSGALWLCVAASTTDGTDITPGAFRKLAGPTTAGSLHLLDAPVRAFDTRPQGNNQGKLQKDAEYLVDLGAAVNGASPVPAGASGVLVNLTATEEEAPGFLALFPDGIDYPGTSNLNFVAETDVANLAVSRVSADAKLRVRCGGGTSAVRTHVVIDVIGYYL
jgi:hypothetical protein